MSTGSLNIPPGGLNGSMNGPPPHSGATTRFDGSRSPPGKQSQYDVLQCSALDADQSANNRYGTRSV